MFCDFRTLEKASSGFFLVPDDLEFEFVESTTSTVINGDASLMWLLRPTANQLSVNISIAANEGDAPLRVFYTVGAPVDLLGYRYIVDPKSDLGERLIADGYTLVFSTKKDEPGVHMVTVFEDDSTTMAIMQLISEPIAVEKQLTYRTALSMLQVNVRELVIAHSPDGQFSNFIFGHDVSRYLPK